MIGQISTQRPANGLRITPRGGPIAAGLDELHQAWGWVLTLGIALIVIGAFRISAASIATLATVLTFGWLLIFGAVISLIHAFQTRAASSFFLHLMSVLLRGVTGFLLIRYPLAGAMGLTLILASFFIVGVCSAPSARRSCDSRAGAGERCQASSCAHRARWSARAPVCPMRAC